MTGDQGDMLVRLKSLLPDGWFTGPTPVLDAFLSAAAWLLAQVYDLTAYAKLQARISTATDAWLDGIADDFFGLKLRRRAGQGDDAYRALILSSLLRPAATRRALDAALFALTGIHPSIFEPNNPQDGGGYDTGALAYDTAGGWGSLQPADAYQAFVTVFRAPGAGAPNVAGWDVSSGAYDVPSYAEILGPDALQGAVSDADIYATIERVRPANVTIWTRIQGLPNVPGTQIGVGGQFDFSDPNNSGLIELV